MINLVLNARTEKKLLQAKQDLPHALLLAGDQGVGLTSIARNLSGKDIAAFIEPMDSKGNVNHKGGTISVGTIRTLYEQTRAKTSTRQIVIIDDADRMSLGAQAAFLKLLEEPSRNTHFILTTHTLQTILPTVRSRTQAILVEPITAKQTKDFIDALSVKDTRTRTQLEYLASGLPAELQRLSSDSSYFNERAEIMGDTRVLLIGSVYDKLLIIHKYHQDRVKSLQLLDSALMVSRRTLSAKPQSNIISQLENLLHAREKIEGNCNIRLQLMTVVL